MRDPIKFSFIIPVKTGGNVSALTPLKNLQSIYPYEIIIAQGSCPSKQRNFAAKQAKGDILYFLDDDSIVPMNILEITSAHFTQNAKLAVAGGPSVTPEDDSPIQKLFGTALSSYFGAASMRARYKCIGKSRISNQKELILCNMAIKKDVFIEFGGFDQRLYPNEENELLDRIQAKGLQILYDPEMAIKRSQRTNLVAFIRQMFNYGRGRGQQTRISSKISLVSLIPFFFIFYLALLPFIFSNEPLFAVFLILYFALNFIFTLNGLIELKSLFASLIFFIYPIMHISNGFGLLTGLIFGVGNKTDLSPIQITSIKPFDTPY